MLSQFAFSCSDCVADSSREQQCISMSAITPLASLHQVSHLVNDVDFVLTDCDGVLYLSKTRIPGTEETIRKLRRQGKKVLFVTNNGAISRKTALAKLNGLGFEAAFDEVFTPSFVVAQYLKSKNFEGKVSLHTSRHSICEQKDL